jgi:hypothetical protein
VEGSTHALIRGYTPEFSSVDRGEIKEFLDYWVFGLCPSPGILKNIKERNVSETRSASVLRRGGGTCPVCSVKPCTH